MKKSIQKSILIITILLAPILFVSLANRNSSKGEVLLIEVMIMSEFSGIYIYQSDKPYEYIKTEISEKVIFESAKNLQTKLQELYNDGWKLAGTQGDAQVQRYILAK